VTSAEAAQALGLPDQAALRTEAFWEWVIERNFVDDSDAATLSAVGVQVVDEVAPFEEAELRLLNGTHSAMACIGALAGLPVISDCIAQPAVHRLVHGLMTSELGPLLRRPDSPDYRDALLQRFANPTLQHSVHQIATDSSQKISQRWVPSALAALQAGPAGGAAGLCRRLLAALLPWRGRAGRRLRPRRSFGRHPDRHGQGRRR